MSQATPLQHLHKLIRNALDPDSSESVRAANLATVSEYSHDLRDLASLVAPTVAGSRAFDLSRSSSNAVTLEAPGTAGRDAYDRRVRRQLVDEIRASQLLADTPGIDPRVYEPGTGATGVGFGLDLTRRVALRRPFVGSKPVVPGIVGGDTLGEERTEGVAPTQAKFTIDDVAVAENREVFTSVALFSSQLRDWADPTGLGMIDQLMTDIADRGAETYFAGRLVVEAGGTRVAGTDLPGALDDAEGAAAAAVTGGPMWLVAHPLNLPAVRRAVAQSWTDQLPHPTVATSVGLAAGTALLVAVDGLAMLADEVAFLSAPAPSIIGSEVSANRPVYLAVRSAVAVQSVTAIP